MLISSIPLLFPHSTTHTKKPSECSLRKHSEGYFFISLFDAVATARETLVAAVGTVEAIVIIAIAVAVAIVHTRARTVAILTLEIAFA